MPTKKQQEQEVFPLPINWQLCAIEREARRRGKSYAHFSAEDLAWDPTLKAKVLEEYCKNYQAEREEEQLRCEVAAEARRKRDEAAMKSGNNEGEA